MVLLNPTTSGDCHLAGAYTTEKRERLGCLAQRGEQHLGV